MNTSEVLLGAARLIDERGWRKGTKGWGWDAAGLCLEGGILAALDMGDDFASERFWSCPAYVAVREYLGLSDERLPAVMDGAPSLPADPLWRWNDANGRTAEEVTTTLRAAALIEAAREQADLPVTTAEFDEFAEVAAS